MLKEINAKDINLSLESFKNDLEDMKHMVVIEIPNSIKELITKRNNGIKLVFENEEYRIIPHNVKFFNYKWYLEISAWGRTK